MTEPDVRQDYAAPVYSGGNGKRTCRMKLKLARPKLLTMRLKILLDKIPENSGTGTLTTIADGRKCACAAGPGSPRHTDAATRGISGNTYRPGTAVSSQNRISMQIC